jgi:hypothetical protein
MGSYVDSFVQRSDEQLGALFGARINSVEIKGNLRG